MSTRRIKRVGIGVKGLVLNHVCFKVNTLSWIRVGRGQTSV
jgi:hypothetical protein